MNCILLEDEPLALGILQNYVSKTPFLHLQATFRDPLKALAYFQQQQTDLVFLDINMPDLNGIQLLKSLPQKPMVIFTTAYSQYAIESYDLNAVDYLLKPIELERFLKAVNKANQLFQLKKNQLVSSTQTSPVEEVTFFFVKSGTKTHKVIFEEILYVEAENSYVSYVTAQKRILSLDRLNALEELLPKGRFIRVHKSFIIALAHIDELQREWIKIKDKRIPIGRAYRKDFFECIKHLGK